jgi:hypothetical protein
MAFQSEDLPPARPEPTKVKQTMLGLSVSHEEFLTGRPDPDQAPKRFLLFDADKNGTVSLQGFITGGKKQESRP